MLYIYIQHSGHIVSVHGGVVEAILKGARGNTSLKKLTILMLPDQLQEVDDMFPDQLQVHLKAAAAELRQVRPQLELVVAY